jgi:hypothetical protein
MSSRQLQLGRAARVSSISSSETSTDHPLDGLEMFASLRSCQFTSTSPRTSRARWAYHESKHCGRLVQLFHRFSTHHQSQISLRDVFQIPQADFPAAGSVCKSLLLASPSGFLQAQLVQSFCNLATINFSWSRWRDSRSRRKNRIY